MSVSHFVLVKTTKSVLYRPENDPGTEMIPMTDTAKNKEWHGLHESLWMYGHLVIAATLCRPGKTPMYFLIRKPR